MTNMRMCWHSCIVPPLQHYNNSVTLHSIDFTINTTKQIHQFMTETYVFILQYDYSLCLFQHYIRPLEKRAVAYLNVDMMEGNFSIAVSAVPLLYQVAYQAAKQVSTCYQTLWNGSFLDFLTS